MRRAALVLALVVAVVVPAGPAWARHTEEPGGTVDPVLAQQLAQAGPGAPVRAVVVLKAEAKAPEVTSRRQRDGGVERALRATAAASQGGVLALLARRRAEGLVGDVEPLWIVNGIAVAARPAVIRELAARRDVREVQPDSTYQAPAAPAATTSSTVPPESNVALVNAPAMWDLGYRGQGVVVANLDTGVDAGHPDLAGRWRGGSNSWYDPNGEHPTTPTDINGHGTATMGVMVGGDAGGTAVGVAPDARWIAVKVFNDRGAATTTGIHKGYQWLLDPDNNPATNDAPDVVDNSWNQSVAGCNLTFQPDLRNLRAAGILPVFSAGNSGPTAGTVYSPANLPEAFPVGATDDADVVDPSSSRGPSACGQPVTPQVVAPGVNIHTTDLYGLYTEASGTSLAAPHVAGALALLLGALPDLPADRQAAGLVGGAVDLGPPGGDNDYGYGRLDVLAAYHWLQTVPDFSVAATPATATVLPGGTATYTVSSTGVNGFAGTVSLSVTGLPGGATATWAGNPVTAPGSATLTVRTTTSTAKGTFTLRITGTSGSLSHPVTVTLTVR